MILVHGQDPLVGDIVRYLTRLHPDTEPLGAEHDAFDAVVARRADFLIGVLHPQADAASSRAMIDDLVRASNAPKPPVVILISALSPDGELARRLRRSGAAYVLIPHRVVHLPAARKPGRVWLARPLARRRADGCTRIELLRTVARAVAPEAPVGVTLEPAAATWETVLAEQGYGVMRVPRWVARVAAWWGRPAAYVDEDTPILELGASRRPWHRPFLRLSSTP